MKRIVLIFFAIIFTFIILALFMNQERNGMLKEEKVVEKKVDDFILHMKVERETSGIEVHQSLQYVGDETIEIQHQTPLISVSIPNKNHDFTGSLVSKKIKKGNIYYQDAATFPAQKKGKNNLYVKAKFLMKGKLINIEHVEPLMFN